MTVYKSRFADVPLRDQTITQRVFEGLSDRMDAVVLMDAASDTALTERQFVDAVQRLAGGLTAAGYGTGHTVALMAPNMPEYCVIFHAVAWAGATLTTLNPTYTANEVRHQLSDAEADILITVPAFAKTAKDGAGSLPVITIGESDYEALKGPPQTTQTPVDLDSHTVVLPYSSGTTGLPKGVRLSHRNLVVNIDQNIKAADIKKGEVVTAFLPFFHIYGMNVLMNTHLALGALITMPRFDLEQFLQINQDHKCKRMWVVPPVVLALAQHPMVDEFDLSSLEQILTGAAPCSAELTDLVSARLGVVVVQGYGMTELSPVSHVASAELARKGSAGVAAPNTQCRIVDPETGADMPAGEVGELWIKGPQVMMAYKNNPTATRETLVEDGWLRTGDIAKIDADGYMYVVDRLKELIKYKGFQVAPAELEAALLSLDGITDAAVVGLSDDEAGEIPVAFIVGGADAPSDDAIHAHFAACLATYKKLHQIHRIDAIPKSASGKILRRVLRSELEKA